MHLAVSDQPTAHRHDGVGASTVTRHLVVERGLRDERRKIEPAADVVGDGRIDWGQLAATNQLQMTMATVAALRSRSNHSRRSTPGSTRAPSGWSALVSSGTCRS